MVTEAPEKLDIDAIPDLNTPMFVNTPGECKHGRSRPFIDYFSGTTDWMFCVCCSTPVNLKQDPRRSCFVWNIIVDNTTQKQFRLVGVFCGECNETGTLPKPHMLGASYFGGNQPHIFSADDPATPTAEPVSLWRVSTPSEDEDYDAYSVWEQKGFYKTSEKNIVYQPRGGGWFHRPFIEVDNTDNHFSSKAKAERHKKELMAAAAAELEEQAQILRAKLGKAVSRG